MKEGKKAAFKFDRFHITEFSYREPNEQEGESLSIRFQPSGVYNPKTGIFKLNVLFSALEKDDAEFIRSSFYAYFEFNSAVPLEEVPSYFYRNSLAIVFPYIRSFISTLTLLANVKLIILPVLNLSELEEPLKLHTVVEELEDSSSTAS